MTRTTHTAVSGEMDDAALAPDPEQSPRRRYARPHLAVYGSVRGLTLGGSPGMGESGGGDMIYKNSGKGFFFGDDAYGDVLP
jgi:hypothetical protein